MKILNPFEKLTKDTAHHTIENLHNNGKNPIALNSPAGSGKTLAGIYYLYFQQKPTIILSTRISINTQWMCELQTFTSDDTKIVNASFHSKITQNLIDSADILLSTEKKMRKITKLDISKFEVLIIDEIQNMLNPGQEFIYRLFANKKMLALSATYPLSHSLKHELLIKYFPKIYSVPRTNLLNIPIYYYETDKQRINSFSYLSCLFPLFRTRCKMLITCRLIKDSIRNYMKLTTLRLPENVKILLVRSGNAYSYILPSRPLYNKSLRELIEEEEDDCSDVEDDQKITSIDTKLFNFFSKHEHVEKNLNIHDLIPKVNIIVSTNMRLQEGFNCPELVFGIFNDFPWNHLNRIQLLGRIRRLNRDQYIHHFPRLAICTANQVHTNWLDKRIRHLIYLYSPKINFLSESPFNMNVYAWNQYNLPDKIVAKIKHLLRNNYSLEIEEKMMRLNNCNKLSNKERLKDKINEILNYVARYSNADEV